MRQIARRAAEPLALVELPAEMPWQKLKTTAGREERGGAEFDVYLKLGPTRTLDQLAAVTRRKPSTIRAWASRYCWLERAAAYDVHHRAADGETLATVAASTNLEVALAMRAEVLRALGEFRARDLAELDTAQVVATLTTLADRLDKFLNPRTSGGGGGTTVNVAVQVGQVDERLEVFTARLRTALDSAGLSPDQWATLEAGMRDQ